MSYCLIIFAAISRLRALSDLEGQMQSQHAELQNLRELQEKQGGGENLFEDLEAQWKETQRAFSDRWVRQEDVDVFDKNGDISE